MSIVENLVCPFVLLILYELLYKLTLGRVYFNFHFEI